MDANVNPIDLSAIEKKATTIIQTAAAASLAIPPPVGEIVAAAIEALQAALEGTSEVVNYAIESRLINALKHAAPYIDARYQDKLFAGIEENTMDVVIAAVKDTAAWKLGVSSNLIGIDSGEVGRLDNVMLNIMYGTGMPRWMALGAISEMSWQNNNKAFSRLCFDQACDIVGQPRSDRDLGHCMTLGYSKWNGLDDVYGEGAPAVPKVLESEYDKEWKKAPLPYSPAVLKQGGGLTQQGVDFYRAATSVAIEDGNYKSEQEFFYDWTVRPAGSTIEFWHSLSHDLWVNSAFNKKQLDDANKAYAEANRAQVKTESSTSYTPKAAGIPTWAKAAAGVAVVALAIAIVRK